MDDDEHDRWADLNTEFHRAIGRITGMPMLQEMTELVLAHWDRIRRHFFKRVFLKRIQRAQHEHHEILHAMQDQNDVLLESLVKIHTQGALAAYMEHLDQRPSEEPPAHPDGSINIRPMPNDQRAQGVSVTNDRAFH